MLCGLDLRHGRWILGRDLEGICRVLCSPCLGVVGRWKGLEWRGSEDLVEDPGFVFCLCFDGRCRALAAVVVLDCSCPEVLFSVEGTAFCK